MIAFLSLGSNLGIRHVYLKQARDAIDECARVCLLAQSSVYENPAQNLGVAPDFLNQVLELDTDFTAQDLLVFAQKLELSAQRQRPKFGHASRTLDVDILAYENHIMKTDDLCIPHPRLSERKFVLQPWAEIAADFVVPGFQKTVVELLGICTDKQELKVFAA